MQETTHVKLCACGRIMKLLKLYACRLACSGGNVKVTAVMGDTAMDGLSDRGSIPLRSIMEKIPAGCLIEKIRAAAGIFCAVVLYKQETG